MVTTKVSFRIPLKLKRRAQKSAADLDISLGALVVTAIDLWLRMDEQEPVQKPRRKSGK